MGTLLGNIMFFSPLLAVLQVRRNADLKDLNPLPFPMVLGNCCSWMAYGLLTHDLFIVLGNLPGILLGLFFVLSTVVHAPPQVKTDCWEDEGIEILMPNYYAFVLAAVGDGDINTCAYADTQQDRVCDACLGI